MTTDNQSTLDNLKEQPFVTHLIELRDRLLRAVMVVGLVFLGLFPFANDIYIWVATPLMAHLPEGASMIATEVASPFLTPFKLTLVAAVFLSMPFILYQLWAFIAPGLYSHEKRLALPLVASSTLLFYLGMLFAYYVVFPLVFAFLTATVPEGVTVATDIAKYLDFILTLFFAFGMAFEVPIATIILVWMGVTSPEKLVQKRPYIIVGAFLIGMLLTPPDVISQTLLAVPMWVLFEIGVFFSRSFVKGAQERAEAARARSDQEQAAPEPAAPAAAAGGVEATDPAPGGEVDPDRFVPLTEEELDAELDLIEAEEEDDLGESDDDELHDQLMEEKLREVQRLRDAEDIDGARKLLFEVLANGNDDQARVASNILKQLDE